YKAYKTYKKVTKVAKVAKKAKRPKGHGNSLSSKRNNHGYEIYIKDKGKKHVVKVGISNSRITKAGTSPRATSQANKWT
ncbi:hypothetical protein ABE42_15650, partial [Bacillus thuringiensis]|nr:hypothetical protein [Bacillus thuringiensis]